MKPRSIRIAESSVLLLLVLSALPAAAGIDRFTPFGPMNGSPNALVADPHAPGSLLAAPALNGIYRSDDGGHAWAWSGAGLGRETIQSIAADPANPGAFYAIAPTQAFRSTDGGRHWTAVASGQHFANLFFSSDLPRFASLALLPGGVGIPPTLLVGAGEQIQRSADGGVTWTTVYTAAKPFSNWALAVDPSDPRRVWAGLTNGVNGGLLLTSTDAGQTWTPLPSLPSAFSQGIRAVLAVPTSPVALFVSAGDAAGSTLWKSLDGGLTWTELQIPAQPDRPFTALAYEPQTPSIVYAAAAGHLFVSFDTGESWTQRGFGLVDFEINTLVPVPGTRILYALSSNDIEVSPDRGRHWTIAAQSGFDFFAPLEHPSLALRFSPGDPSRVYAILDGRGFQSADGGATWVSFATDREPLYNARPQDLAIDPANPNILYILTSDTLFRSTDRGATWAIWGQPQGQGEGGFTHLLLFGRKPTLVADCGVSLSRDGGRTWTRTLGCGATLPGDFEGRRVDRLLFDPRQSSVVYAEVTEIIGRHPAMPNPQTWKSLDGGATWRLLIPDSEAMALDPSQVGRLYAARPAGFERSDNGGRTFRKLSDFGASPSVVTGVYVTDLQVDPVTPTTLYAGTRDRGVWRSTDGGVNWEPVNAGLARYTDLQTYQLMLHPTVPHLLFAEVDGWIFQSLFTTP